MILGLSLTESITELIGNAGVYAVFGLMALDAVFPAASELVMVYAGALAAGAFPESTVEVFGIEIESTWWGYVVVAAAGTIGYWLGALGGWWLGRWGGRPFLEKYGHYFHLGPRRLERADAWFEERGDRAVFLGRVLPVVRSFVSVPAGALGVRFGPYSWATLIGSALWCFAFAAVGVGVGESWESFHDGFRYADIAIVVVIVFAIAYFGWKYMRKRASRPEAPTS
jgi:membrane protein DedA with SNARE-associated domain